MKIAFVYLGYENLGVGYLSAVLKENGHETLLVHDPMLFDDSIVSNKLLHAIFSFERQVVDQVVASKPDLIAFSFTSEDYPKACKLACEMKKRLSTPIVFGGIHVTSVPEHVIKNDFVDFIIIGEGEYPLLDLVEALKMEDNNFDIKNVWYKADGKVVKNEIRALVEDLDSIPYPDKDLFGDYILVGRKYTLMTSRGCPYKCTYCANSYLKKLYEGKGCYLRRRSVENVLDELRVAVKTYHPNHILFHDEIFTYDIVWLQEFLPKYKTEIGLPFFCWVHPSTINKQVVDLLVETGCGGVEMGIQTINPRVGREIIHRFVPEDKISAAIKLFTASDIMCKVDIMFGLPGMREEDYIELLRFYNQNRADYPIIYWLKYYPKTEIVGISESMGILNQQDVDKIESCLDAESFIRGGDTFTKNTGKFHNLLLMTQFLPKSTIEYILHKKFYRFLPGRVLFLPSLVFVVFYQNFLSLFRRKNPILVSDISGHYRYFIKEKIRHWLSF